MYRPNVSMIVFRRDDGRFLLVHKNRKHHAWQFPQGGVEEGEELKQAARRELQEELGTSHFTGFFKSQHVLFYSFPTDYPYSDTYKGQKQNYFLVEFTGTDRDITLDKNELDDYKWVYSTELLEYIESIDYYQTVLKVINEFDSHLNGL